MPENKNMEDSTFKLTSLWFNARQANELKRLADTSQATQRALSEMRSLQRMHVEALQDERRQASVEESLREHIFQVRGEYDCASLEGDPLRAIFILANIKSRIDEIDSRMFRTIDDKEYLRQTDILINSAIAQTLEIWAPGPREAVIELLRISSETLSLIAIIVERRELHSQMLRATADQRYLETRLEQIQSNTNASLWEQINELSERIGRVHALIPIITGITDTSFPLTQMIDDAQATIVLAHSKSIFAFKCLAFIAKTDGNVSSTERDFLSKLAMVLDLRKEEAEALIHDTVRISPRDFCGDTDDATTLVKCLLRFSEIEGEKSLRIRRRRIVEKLGGALRVSPLTFDEPAVGSGTDVARASQVGPIPTPGSVSFLDSATAATILQKKPLPKFCHVGNSNEGQQVRAKIIEWGLGFSDDDSILLVCQPRTFLGPLKECAAITKQKLYIFSYSKHAIDVIHLDSLRPHFMNVDLLLGDGTTFTFSSLFADFLSRCIDCVRQSLRSI